jgi:hypothetical protein
MCLELTLHMPDQHSRSFRVFRLKRALKWARTRFLAGAYADGEIDIGANGGIAAKE